MPTPDECPFCGSSRLVAGKVIGPKGYGFQPKDLITGFVFTLRMPWAIDFGPRAHFCPECCMVWSQVAPKKAANFLAKFANGALKDILAPITIGSKAASQR